MSTRSWLVAVRAEENNIVVAGQILAEVDSLSIAAELEIAQKTVEVRRAKRARVANGPRPVEREMVRVRLKAAAATFDLARKEYARSVPLGASGVLATTDVDSARARLQDAEFEEAHERAQLALIESLPRKDDIHIADAQLALANANLRAIEVRLEQTFVRAPFDGIVLKRYKNTGESVGIAPPTPLFVVASVAKRRVRVEIDEIDVAVAQVGDAAYVRADAFAGETFCGQIVRVGACMLRKSTFSQRPGERQDRDVLEVIVELDSALKLPIGLRVDVFSGSCDAAQTAL